MIIHTQCISWLDLKGFDLDLQYDLTAPTDANYGSKEAIRRARARSKGLSLRCERVILVYDVPVKSSPQYHWIILKFLRILTGIAHIFKTMPGLLWLEQTGRMTARKLLAKDDNDLLKPFVEILPVGWPSHFLVGYLSQMSSAELTCPGPAAPSAEEAGLLGDKTLPNLSVIPFSCLPKRELTTYREQTYGPASIPPKPREKCMFAPNLDIVNLRPVSRGTPGLGKLKQNCRAISTNDGMSSTISRPSWIGML